MIERLDLPPALDAFARAVVKNGRYADLNAVLAEGLRLLQDREAARAAFVQTLLDAEAESDRDGWVSAEDALAEADEIIARAEIEHARRAAGA
jgi:putative addiction module CopG family antidote